MRLLSTAGLLLGATMTFGLAACGGGSSDYSNISSAAMTGGDIPSGFQLNTAATADSFSAYTSPSLINYGKTTITCANSQSISTEKNNLQHGLAQSALDANGYGIVDCAEIINSDDNTKAVFDHGKSQANKSPFHTVSAQQVGDDSFAAEAVSGGVTGRVYAFRHANILVALEFISKTGNVSMDELYTIAKNIDGRLK